jgi:signal transduction histidine kinase
MADGLRNMQQRLAELGGVCRISSRPGEGTCVSLKLAWSGS